MTTTAQTVSGKYTEEILNKNFTAIAKEFERVEAWRKHMGGHIAELFDASNEIGQTMLELAQATQKAVSKPKGIKTKYKVALGVAAGIYIGQKLMTHEFNEKLERVKREAKEQFDNFVASQNSANEQRKTSASSEFRGTV